MSKEKQSQHDREMSEIRAMHAESAKRHAEFDKRMDRLAQQAEEDRKRAAQERAEDRKHAAEERKRAAQERAEDRKRAAEERKHAAQERKRAAQERAEDRKHAAKVREEYERRLTRMEEIVARTEELVAKNAKYIGEHSNNEGELLEITCRATLVKMGKIDGVALDDVRRMQSAKYGVEVDIVGVNGKIVFPVEVKRTLSPDDVRHFANVRVERFREVLADGKEVRPVIIFGLPRSGKSKEDPVQVALNLGLIVMQSIGENKLAPITNASQVIKRQHKED